MAMLDGLKSIFEQSLRFCKNKISYDFLVRRWNEECEEVYKYKQELIAEERAKHKPTADVEEVKHGKWEDLYKGRYDNPLYTCSECYCRALYKPEKDELGNTIFKQELSKICPRCFAKMDGGETK